MIEWRTDKPTEDIIVAQLSSDFCGEERYTILSIATKPYKHYHEDGEEVPLGAIVKWASLKEEPDVDVNAIQFYHDVVELIGFKDMPVCDDLDKAARKYAGIPEDSPHDLTYCVQDKKAKYAAVLFGANWLMQKMMKGAKSGIGNYDNYINLEDGTWIDLDPSMQKKPAFNVSEGDKVKVIVIKEE